MKKIVTLVLASFALLVACAPAKQETKTETYEYVQKLGETTQTIRETITYKGDEFKKLELYFEQPMDDTTKASLQERDFEEAKTELLGFMEDNYVMKELKALEGVTVQMDLKEDYTLVFTFTVDMKKADLDALAAIDEFGVDITALKDTTPKAYIEGLKENEGAKLVNN